MLHQGVKYETRFKSQGEEKKKQNKQIISLRNIPRILVSLIEPIYIEYPFNNLHDHLCRMIMEIGNAENELKFETLFKGKEKEKLQNYYLCSMILKNRKIMHTSIYIYSYA